MPVPVLQPGSLCVRLALDQPRFCFCFPRFGALPPSLSPSLVCGIIASLVWLPMGPAFLGLFRRELAVRTTVAWLARIALTSSGFLGVGYSVVKDRGADTAPDNYSAVGCAPSENRGIDNNPKQTNKTMW